MDQVRTFVVQAYGPRMGAWVTGQDIASILRVPLGTIRRWASDENWPRKKHGGRVLYAWESAAERYDRRRSFSVSLDDVTSDEASSDQCDDSCPE